MSADLNLFFFYNSKEKTVFVDNIFAETLSYPYDKDHINGPRLFKYFFRH